PKRGPEGPLYPNDKPALPEPEARSTTRARSALYPNDKPALPVPEGPLYPSRRYNHVRAARSTDRAEPPVARTGAARSATTTSPAASYNRSIAWHPHLS